MAKRKFDVTNPRQCIRIIPNGLNTHTEIYCVECERWRGVRMVAMARVEFTTAGLQTQEVDADSASFECVACRADVGYLLDGQVERVIRELGG